MNYQDYTVREDEYGCLWLVSPQGDIVSEVFTASEDETDQDREDGGYTPIPLEWEGEPLYVLNPL